MKKALFFFTCLIFFSCSNTTTKKETNKMYQATEMALLMNEMYQKSDLIRSQIINGDTIASFPESFLKIHSAILTDPSDRNESFNSYSNVYIQKVRELYTTPKDSLKIVFNSTVKSCVACHQTTCTGPISRIEKLYIKDNN